MTLQGHGRLPWCLRLLGCMTGSAGRVFAPPEPFFRRRFCHAPGLLCAIGLGLAIIPTAYSDIGEPVSLEQLQTQLEQTQTGIDELVGGSDLLDALYSGWSDRPYTRATLAVLVKSTSVLQRELHLRQRGNGALTDETVETILLWRQQAVKRIHAPAAPAVSFRPHRIRISASHLQEASAIVSLYGMVDATTVTRNDRVLGDLDLVAALGFRVYAHADTPLQPDAVRTIQRQRAHALGMATVRLVSRNQQRASPSRPSGEDMLTVMTATLSELLTMAPSQFATPNTAIALRDPPRGESWASHVARRSLARGMSGHGRFITAGWTPPTARSSSDGGVIEATMWLDAVEGQSLGLIPGWRDLRDGSASVYPSLLPKPAKIEAIAVAALNLIRLGHCVAAFRSTPPMAIVVGRDAIDSTDDNAWADWIEPVWTELFWHQIRYDVIGSTQELETPQRRYRIVQPLRQEAAKDPHALVASWEQRLTNHGGSIERFAPWDANGNRARHIVVRGGEDAKRGSWLMIANLSADPRSIVFRPAYSLKPMRDLISDQTLTTQAVSLRPWQVRILTSSK